MPAEGLRLGRASSSLSALLALAICALVVVGLCRGGARSQLAPESPARFQVKNCHHQHTQQSRTSNMNSTEEALLREQQQRSPLERTHRLHSARCRAGTSELDALEAASLSESCGAWRFRYIDEQADGGHEVHLLDGSLDERLANSIYTTVSINVVNMDFFKFGSGDAQLDARNLAAVAPPDTNDELCHEQLSAMLELQAELSQLVADRRSSGGSTGRALEERHIRLARVLDSFGRFESGQLLGKTHNPGQYDECVSSQLQLGRERVRTRFCWARMDLSKHLSPSLAARQTSPFEASEHPLMVGACLPRACHSRSFRRGPPNSLPDANHRLAERLVQSQFQLPRSIYLEDSLPVAELFCLADRDSSLGLPLAGKLALALLLGWLALAVYATYYHEGRTRRTGTNKKDDDEDSARQSGRNLLDRSLWAQSLLDCLNLKKSWQDFVGEPYDGERAHASLPKSRIVELDTLNPVKAFSCAFVVLGHSVIIQAASSNDKLRAYNKIENDPLVLSMIVGTVVVDTFFVITGILMAYVAMRRSTRSGRARREGAPGGAHGELATAPVADVAGGVSTGKLSVAGAEARGQSLVVVFSKQWAKLVMTRNLRLLPLFFLVYWFKRSVFIRGAGAGLPFWDMGFNKDTSFGACLQESWWTPFTMMTAFKPLSQQCLPQSWSISADLFFTIFITPLVLLLTKSARLGLSLALLMGLLTYLWTLRDYQAIEPHFAFEVSHLRAHGFAFMFGPLHHLYTSPQYRFPQVIIGLAVGYLLHRHEEAGERRAWPRWLRGPATLFSLTSSVAIFVIVGLAPQLKSLVAPHEQAVFTHLFTTGRIVWALCNGTLFIRMSTDWRQSFLMRQFSSGFWSSLVRLNLAILLIHMDILLYQMGAQTSLPYFSKQNVFNQFGATYMYCLPVAVFLHVVYENPVDKLVRRHVLPRVLP